MEVTAEPRVLAESSGLHHIALLTSTRERMPCPPLGLPWNLVAGAEICLIVSGHTVCFRYDKLPRGQEAVSGFSAGTRDWWAEMERG